MNRKQKFMQAVRILAPGDQFILRAARGVREETLPMAPGGAALEFVATMEKVKAAEPSASPPARAAAPERSGRIEAGAGMQPSAGPRGQDLEPAERKQGQLPMQEALRVKSAEFWLKLGQPVQALMELNQVPDSLRKHPWALRVFLAAMRQAWESNEYPAHAE
jgi:hypothetical protein